MSDKCRIERYIAGNWTPVQPTHLAYSVRIIGVLATVAIRMRISNELKTSVSLSFKCNLPDHSWINYVEATTDSTKVRVYKEYTKGNFRYSSAEENGKVLTLLKDPVKQSVNIHYSYLGAQKSAIFTISTIFSLSPLKNSKWALIFPSMFASKSLPWSMNIKIDWPTSNYTLSSTTRPSISLIGDHQDNKMYVLKGNGTQTIKLLITDNSTSEVLISKALVNKSQTTGVVTRLAVAITYRHSFLDHYIKDIELGNSSAAAIKSQEDSYMPSYVYFVLDLSSNIDHARFVLKFLINTLPSSVYFNVGVLNAEGHYSFFESSQLVAIKRQAANSLIDSLGKSTMFEVDKRMSEMLENDLNNQNWTQTTSMKSVVILSDNWKECEYYYVHNSLKKYAKIGVKIFPINTGDHQEMPKIISVAEQSEGKQLYLGENLDINEYHSIITELVYQSLSKSSEMLVNFNITYDINQVLYIVPNLNQISRIHPSRPITFYLFLNSSILSLTAPPEVTLTLTFTCAVSNEQTTKSIHIDTTGHTPYHNLIHQAAIEQAIETSAIHDRLPSPVTSKLSAVFDGSRDDACHAIEPWMADYGYANVN